MRNARLAWLIFGMNLVGHAAGASDAYIISANAAVPLPEGSGGAAWVTATKFFNTTGQPATGHLVGLSNGASAQAPADASFPPNTLRGFPSSWFPEDPGPSLYVTHIDVPPGVLVSDRLFYYRETPCGFPACGPGNTGGIQLPVFRSLVAAGKKQVLLDADLGEALPVRSNVTLYNASDTTAIATIEVHVGCDGSLAGSQTVTVGPDSIVQIQAFATVGSEEACNPFDPENAPVGSRYITVVMDQPGFSLLSVLKNGTFDYTIPIGISAGVATP